MAFKYLDTMSGSILGISESFKVDKCLMVKKKKRKLIPIQLYKAKPEIVEIQALFQIVNSAGNLGSSQGVLTITMPDNSLVLTSVDPITGIVVLDVDSPAIPTTQPQASTVSELAITDLFIQPTPL